VQQRRHGADRIRAAAESEQKQAVAVFEVVGDEDVSIPNVVVEVVIPGSPALRFAPE
jgi:hypothetical protein